MTEHYFSDTPTGPERRREVTVDLFGRTVTVETANGVFAGDGLDRGTAVLLREVPPPTGSPRILDLGCGWGPIALGLALACPGAVIDAVDVNDRALALCRDNADRLQRGPAGPGPPTRPGARRDQVRPALVQPADPDRQGGAARSAARPGCRG